MRVKRGIASRRRHNKYRKAAKGFIGRRKSCFALAKDAVDRSMAYATRDRRVRRRDFRSLWIMRINAAARLSGLTYSRLVAGLREAQIEIDRKVLAHLAVQEPEAFSAIAERAKAALR